jgi:DNA adenine methylase
MKPLYIWAGGKNKMIPKYELDPGIPLSGYDTFVEPFFGGGAMMIYIYKNNPTVQKFVMNDINAEIVGLYRAIKTDPAVFIDRMDSLQSQYLPLNKVDRKKFYYALREQYTKHWTQWTATEESASLYFLMKTGFNGIWQTTQTSNGRYATPSGLLNQKTSVYDRDNVMEWHTFLQRVDIHCGDWNSCTADIGERAFYFFDPPYRDSFTSYSQVFGDAQHVQLIDFCKTADSAGHLVMYCNRDANDDFYTINRGHLDISYYSVTYTAGRRKKNDDGSQTAKTAREILLYSPSIKTMNCAKMPVIKQTKKAKSKLVEFANPGLIS